MCVLQTAHLPILPFTIILYVAAKEQLDVTSDIPCIFLLACNWSIVMDSTFMLSIPTKSICHEINSASQLLDFWPIRTLLHSKNQIVVLANNLVTVVV